MFWNKTRRRPPSDERLAPAMIQATRRLGGSPLSHTVHNSLLASSFSAGSKVSGSPLTGSTHGGATVGGSALSGFTGSGFSGGAVLNPHELLLYDTLRESVPIIDAALTKIIRLVGGFTVSCPDRNATRALGEFLQYVPVGGVSLGVEGFLNCYLDNLLTYGNAVGEIILDKNSSHIAGLYNGPLMELTIQKGLNPLSRRLFLRDGSPEGRPIHDNGRIFFTALNPRPGEVVGNSILKGLPFVTGILLRILEATGNNFERIGNVRYAVTYNPGGDAVDRAYAKDRASQIAKEWSAGMTAAKNGEVSDFVSVGDVDIKVIGADNQIIDTEVPVRQILEQIVAKLGVPPFLLGLSWSTTERMSKQQADILTSELSYYRRILSPILLKICRTFLRLEGYAGDPVLTWSTINLQDEGEMAHARLYNAQAAALELSQHGSPDSSPVAGGGKSPENSPGV